MNMTVLKRMIMTKQGNSITLQKFPTIEEQKSHSAVFAVRLAQQQYYILYLISNRMHGKSILKNAHFSGKGHQSLHASCINVMRIRKMLIHCVKLDHGSCVVFD